MLRLASHFKAEAAVLQAAAIEAWPALAALSDADLRRLASSGRASEQRLIKLRGQARLVVQVGLEPEEAALLLYAGIASTQGLAEASHHQLLVQLGRLERSLTGMAPPRVDGVTLQRWIRQARQAAARPPN
jgi:hypothetical protein